MALHYLLCFGLLILEITCFFVLIAPLPFTARRSLFRFLASPPARRVQYWFKIAFIFAGILFVDAVQKMVAAAKHLAELEHQNIGDTTGQAAIVATLASGEEGSPSALVSKFYTERNFYLTGFTLLLGLIHSRVFRLINELIDTQEELFTLQSKDSSAPATEGSAAEVEAKYRQEIETLKKQTHQQQLEYNRLSDELAAKTGSVSDKRVD